MKRRIESTTSRTAEMTCLSRACSALETNHYYKSDDHIATLLLPTGLKPFLHISLARRLFTKMAAPKWHFGIEKGQIEPFLAKYGMQLTDHKDAKNLESAYFTDSNGKVIGRVNGTHCLVTAEKR